MMSNPEIKITPTEDVIIMPNNESEECTKAGIPDPSQISEHVEDSLHLDEEINDKNNLDDDDGDLVTLNKGISNDIDPQEEHSSGDSLTVSTRGSTTPVLESTSISPISELSDKSPEDSDLEGSSSKSPTEECDENTSLTENSSQSVPQVSSGKRIVYSRNELVELMNVPASLLWPHYLDTTFKKVQMIDNSLKKTQCKFDLEKWMRSQQDLRGHKSNKVASTSASSSQSGSNDNRAYEAEVKKSRDPRERIKDEQDGIVLSPQRRSFGTGCQVMPQVLSSHEVPALERPRESHRDLPARRIGSGRILRRDETDHGLMERRRERDSSDRDQDLRRDHKDWRSKFGNRYDCDDRHIERRRRFFEDEEIKKGGGSGRREYGPKENNNNRRFHENRRYSFSKEEDEPEWFTEGPSSQNEFIDLVGFEDFPNDEKFEEVHVTKRERRRSGRRSNGSARSSRCNTPVIKEVEEPVDDDHDANVENIDGTIVEKQTLPTGQIVESEFRGNEDQDDIQFNVVDYLGSILNIGGDEMVDNDSVGVSHLKKFFRNHESPIEASNLSPVPMDRQPYTQVGSLLGFNNDALARIPSPDAGLDSNRFFAPISPAAKDAGENIVEMLHQVNSKRIPPQAPLVGSGRLPQPSLKDLLMDGRSQILEEVEANLRKDHRPSSSSMTEKQINNLRQQLCSNQSNFPVNMTPMGAQQMMPANPFNELSKNQNSKFFDKKREDGCVISKWLGESGLKFNGQIEAAALASKSHSSNISQTENEMISRLLKIGSTGGGSVVPPMPNATGTRLQPPMNNLGVATLNNSLSSNVQSNIPQHSSTKPVFMPPNTQQVKPASLNTDLMKLMQNQQKKQIVQQTHYQPQTQSDPIKNLLGALNNMSMSSTQSSNQEIQRERLMRPDVRKLLQRIVSGQINEGHLIAQLNSGNLNPQQRESVAIVLKILSSNQPQNPALVVPQRNNLTPSPTFQQQNMLNSGIGISGPPIAHNLASNPDTSNLLAPQMMSQAARLSPMLCGTNTGPLRTPSRQEMIAHTQNILQNALLKQELEKAKEKHRKREAENIRSPNSIMAQINNRAMMGSNIVSVAAMNNRPGQGGSPTKGLKCQSPLAFTPTSVMRKMTAERERPDRDFKPEGYSAMEIEKSLRDAMTNRVQQGSLKMDNKGISGSVAAASPLSPGNSMLGPRAQMVMSGSQTFPMGNVGAPHSNMINTPQQRSNTAAMSFPSQQQQSIHNMSTLSRPSQHAVNNIRALQQAQASYNQQMMRSQMAPSMVNPNQVVPNRVAINSSSRSNMQHLMMGNNANNNFGIDGNNLAMGQQGSANPGSSFNLMSLFGQDSFNKVQVGTLPDMPGGKVLSLEEVEKLQQAHTK